MAISFLSRCSSNCIAFCKAAIWRNDDGSNGPWHGVSFERVYKDGDEWKSSGSFGRDDLLVLAKVIDQAHSWVVENDARGELIVGMITSLLPFTTSVGCLIFLR